MIAAACTYQRHRPGIIWGSLPISVRHLPFSFFSLSLRDTEQNLCSCIRPLDLLTTEAPYNKAKVSLKLHELEYKIDVEKKLSDGIRNFARALDRDQSRLDRRRRDEIKAEMCENQEKLDLLNQALKKYKELYIDEGDDDTGKERMCVDRYSTAP